MELIPDDNYIIRKLPEEESIPYELLLLADETIEAIDKYIHGSDIYILEHENKATAIYALQALNKDEIEIKNIAVIKEHQGKGIGSTLLRDAINKAREKGFKTILIGTASTATRQLNLYQKEGFEIFHIKKDFFIDNYTVPIYEEGILLKDMIMLKKKLH